MKQNNKCSPFGAVVAAATLALMIALTACSSPTGGGGGGGDGGGNTTVKIPDELVGGWVTKETIGQTYLFHITSDGVFRVPGHSDKDFDKVSVSGKTVTIKAGGVTLGTFDYGIRNNEMAVTNPTGIFAFIADIVPPTLEKATDDNYPIRGGSYLAVTNWPAMIYDVLITTAAINASSSYNELAQDAAHKKAEKKQVHSPLYFSHDVLIGNFNVFIIGEEMGVGVPDPEDIPSPPIKIIKYQNGVTFNVRHDAAINWDAMITGGQP